MFLAIMHCAGLYGLLAFVPSVVIPEPTPPSSLRHVSLGLGLGFGSGFRVIGGGTHLGLRHTEPIPFAGCREALQPVPTGTFNIYARGGLCHIYARGGLCLSSQYPQAPSNLSWDLPATQLMAAASVGCGFG